MRDCEVFSGASEWKRRLLHSPLHNVLLVFGFQIYAALPCEKFHSALGCGTENSEHSSNAFNHLMIKRIH